MKNSKRVKGPRSAYIYFLKDYQRYLRKTQGPLPFGESSKMCAARWRLLSKEDKAIYRKMSQRDALRYKKQFERLSPKEQKQMRRKKKDPEAPLRPMSAYLWFCKSKWKEVADKYPLLQYTKIMKHLAKLWARCDQKTRQRFQRIADCDRKCYHLEKARYRKQCKRKGKV